jgi:hypothetical protein
MIDNLVEWRLAEETEVLGGNLPQRHFVHHKSHLTTPGSNPGRRCGKPATNRLSYGAAIFIRKFQRSISRVMILVEIILSIFAYNRYFVTSVLKSSVLNCLSAVLL